MDATNLIEPTYLILAVIAWLVLGLLITRKVPARWRLAWLMVWLIPTIGLVSEALHIRNGMREDARKSAKIFADFSTGPDLTSQETEAFRALSMSSPRVREGVMRLAFANSANAALAMPRLEILLQSALQLDPTGKRREPLWKNVVEPALQQKPPREIILLAAATAAIGGYGLSQATNVLQRMQPLFANGTNSGARAIALGVFVPLVDFAPMEQVETTANLLLLELLEEQNPMQANPMIGSVNPTGSRRVSDLRRVAARLSGVSARHFADRVIPEISPQTNASRVLALGLVLLTVKSELSSDQIDRAVTNLVRQLPRNQGGVLQERASPLTGLAAVMTPEQAVKTVNLLLACLQQERDPWWHTELARPLKPLALRLSDEDAQSLAEPMEGASSDVVEVIRDRIPPEQVYLSLERLIQGILDTPNPNSRAWQVPRIEPLAIRLTPELAGKLADELWPIFLRDKDESRRWDEAGCLIALATRLKDEQAASLAKLVVEQMKQPDVNLPVLMKILTPLLSRCDQATVQEAVACLMKSYDRPKLSFGSTGLEQRDFLIGAHLTPAQMKLVLEPLVTDLEKQTDPEIFPGWAASLASLADQLAPDQMERVGNRLVFLYTQRPHGFGLVSLNLIATNVVLTPYQSKQILDIILPQALECRMPQSPMSAQDLGVFVRRLDPAQVEATGQVIISAMGRMREPICAMLDAKCLMQVTEALRPDQARRLAEQLLQIPVQRGNYPGFTSLIDFSRYPPSSTDWALPAVFIERQESWTYNYRLEAWSRSMAALMARMEKDDARNVADQVAARCADQGLVGPVTFEEQTATVLQYASEPALTKILRSPFAVGGLRLIALHAGN